MSLLKIIDLKNGNRLFRWQHEKGGCAFVEWKREQTLALELGWNDPLESIHDDWEWDADMMIEMLKSYKDRGVERVDWEYSRVYSTKNLERSIIEVINQLEYELLCGWDVWVGDE